MESTDNKTMQQDDADALYRKGELYYYGECVSQDYAKAFDFFLRSALLGHAKAQNSIGYCYEKGIGSDHDIDEAKYWYRKSAEQDNAAAQYHLATLHDFGRGVAIDKKEAAKWYRRAAEQGHATAQYNIGVCYTFGEGVQQNDIEAVKWYRKAAEQGVVDAEYNLGVCYGNGDGVEQDSAEAVKWYTKAAGHGYALAETKLGTCFYNGDGVAQSYRQAAKWYREAAEKGHAGAQYNLGMLYEKGKGVKQNISTAMRWYNLAMEQRYIAKDGNLPFAECEKDTVFISSWLSGRRSKYSAIADGIKKILASNNVDCHTMSGTADIWCRDYMPIQNGINSYVQFAYSPDYLKGKEQYITDVDELMRRSPLDKLHVVKCPLVIDGGNIVVCNELQGNVVIMTTKVLKENPQYKSLKEIEAMLRTSDVFGWNTEIVWLPWDKGDTCGHTDGIVHFVSCGNNGRATVLANLANYPKRIAERMRSILSNRFNLVELKLNEYPEGSWAYVNFLQTSKVIIVPALGRKTDKEALGQIKALYPQYEDRVYQIECMPLIKDGGALNCATWTTKLIPF